MVAVWVGIFIAAVMQLAFSYTLNKGQLQQNAAEKLQSEMRIGYALFDKEFPGDWHVENGVLYKGEVALSDQTGVSAVLQRMEGLTEGNHIAIFQGNEQVAGNGALVASGDARTVMKTALDAGRFQSGREQTGGIWNYNAYEPIKNQAGETIAAWHMGIPEQRYIEQSQRGITPNLIMAYVSASIYAGILFFVLRYLVFTPIRKLQVFANEIANYNLKIEPIAMKRDDEIGRVTKSFNSMLESLRDIVGNVSQSAGRVADISVNLSESANQTEITSQQVALSIADVADGTTKQAEHTASIIEMIEDTKNRVETGDQESLRILDNTQQSTDTARKGQTAISKAIENLSSVTTTVQFATDAIQKLGKRSDEIGGIVTIISDISNQTNLLALNAAIEAARAGEHGRGFAIVSDEVRKLAEQSNQAAEQISNLIQDIQAETSVTVRTMESNLEAVQSQVNMIREGGKALEQIVENVERSELDAKHIKGIFQDLKDNAAQVLHAVQGISDILSQAVASAQQVAAAAEEQSATVEEIAGHAGELASMSDGLKKEVNKFQT